MCFICEEVLPRTPTLHTTQTAMGVLRYLSSLWNVLVIETLLQFKNDKATYLNIEDSGEDKDEQEKESKTHLGKWTRVCRTRDL